MIHLVFNSPYLGGAERSAIEQSYLTFKSSQIAFHIPKLHKNNKQCEIAQSILSRFNNPQIFYYPIPFQLFKVSRSSLLSQLLGFFYIPFSVFKIHIYLKNLKLNLDDSLWLNGNKAAILFILSLVCGKSDAKWIWHWRDYPSQTGFLSFIKWPLLFLRPKRFLLLANSQSVEDSLKVWFSDESIETEFVYNPSGVIAKKLNFSIETIGLASMLAPWKGQHEVILNISLIKEELMKLGIKRVLIFGEDIYQTSGEHRGYKKQLEDLVLKLKLDNFIFFNGNQAPIDIFKQLDILVHSSLKPEPFGRVLIESFSAHIPVLSTAIGGAGEVLGEHSERGWKYHPYHPNDFLFKISQIILDKNTKIRLQHASDWSTQVNLEIPVKLKRLLKN